MPDPRSALAQVATGAAELAAGLTCREIAMADLVTVSAWPDTQDRVFGAVAGLLGTDIPPDCRTATGSDAVRLFRIAPRRLMIVSAATALLAPLRAAVAAGDGAVSAQGHSRVRIRLRGPGAVALLARGAPVDLDARAFAPGAFAQTAIHHMPVLIHRPTAGNETFDLYVLRSFALSFWQWLSETAFIATQTPEGLGTLAGQPGQARSAQKGTSCLSGP